MPYPGLDSKQSTWMDACSTSIMDDWEKRHDPSVKGLSHEERKSKSIAICRATLNRMHGHVGKAQFILDRNLINEFLDIMEQNKLE